MKKIDIAIVQLEQLKDHLSGAGIIELLRRIDGTINLLIEIGDEEEACVHQLPSS